MKVDPIQILDKGGPVIPEGNGFTVIVSVAAHEVANEVMTATLPADTPVKVAVEPAPTIVPVPVRFVRVHEIPIPASLNVMVDPSQTTLGPVIGGGTGLTVTCTAVRGLVMPPMVVCT